MRRWDIRTLVMLLALLALVAVGWAGARYRIAQLVDQSRLQRQRIEMIIEMKADGRTPDEIEAAVEAMNRRYER